MKPRLTPKQRIRNAVIIHPETQCWEWQRATVNNGYGQLHYQGRTTTAHRVAYQLWVGEIPKGGVIMHQCDNPPCCNPAHLKLGTQRDNMQHAANMRRIKMPNLRGEDHGNALLYDKDVIQYRKEYQAGRSLKSIIEETGMAEASIKRMLWGKTYSHLEKFPRKDSMMNCRKVTLEQKDEIIRRRRAGERTTDLAIEFGLTQTGVSKIMKRARAA